MQTDCSLNTAKNKTTKYFYDLTKIAYTGVHVTCNGDPHIIRKNISQILVRLSLFTCASCG